MTEWEGVMSERKSEEARLRELLEAIQPFDGVEENAGEIGVAAADRALDAYDKSYRENVEKKKRLKG